MFEQSLHTAGKSQRTASVQTVQFNVDFKLNFNNHIGIQLKRAQNAFMLNKK
jgi:hypothetical protein